MKTAKHKPHCNVVEAICFKMAQKCTIIKYQVKYHCLCSIKYYICCALCSLAPSGPGESIRSFSLLKATLISIYCSNNSSNNY